MTPDPVRLNKTLAELGFGSRRAIDAAIASGRILVNGQPATLGQKVLPTDAIIFDGQPVDRRPHEKIVVVLHKPRGVTTTKRDPFAKVTVLDYLPPKYQHLYPVGRLDRESRGLLLLTNDGALAEQLAHPRFEHEKEYAVEVVPHQRTTKAIFTKHAARLAREVIDPAHQTRPFTVKQSAFDPQKQQGHLTLILREGRKREIRHVLHALGYTVTDLLRTRIGSITLDQLPEGAYAVVDPKKLSLHA